jgi:hypothetical protein
VAQYSDDGGREENLEPWHCNCNMFPPLSCYPCHRPNFCIQVITKVIRRAALPQELVIRIDENISKILSAVSTCERILNTPIPLVGTRTGARHLHRLGLE